MQVEISSLKDRELGAEYVQREGRGARAAAVAAAENQELGKSEIKICF